MGPRSCGSLLRAEDRGIHEHRNTQLSARPLWQPSGWACAQVAMPCVPLQALSGNLVPNPPARPTLPTRDRLGKASKAGKAEAESHLDVVDSDCIVIRRPMTFASPAATAPRSPHTHTASTTSSLPAHFPTKTAPLPPTPPSSTRAVPAFDIQHNAAPLHPYTTHTTTRASLRLLPLCCTSSLHSL